jgi:hypothetical protein
MSMRFKFNALVCGFLALATPQVMRAESGNDGKCSALENAVILVIRHAEKPESGPGLSAQGEARAKAYVNYFKSFRIDSQLLKLETIFAAADSKASHRPRLTVEPTAQAFNLAIDSRFKHEDYQEMVDEIRGQPHGKAMLIAWHRGEIPQLLRALGADPKQLLPKAKWAEEVFGWVIQLRYGADGRLVEAKRINEHLLPDDTETDVEK